MNSWLNDTPTALRRNATNTLHLHPDDAEPLGIRTGDTVRVSSRVDALECTAEVSTTPGWCGHSRPWLGVSRFSTRRTSSLPNLMVQIGMHL